MRKFTYLLLLIMLCTGQVFAQGRKISGTVTDAKDGSTMPGVNVILKGTTSGAVSDVNGRYEINVTGKNQVLVFKFIGYKTQEIEIANNNEINVQMAVESQRLDEIVVIGYGIQRKSDLTGSVSSMKGKDLSKIATSSAVQAMQGKVAGIQVSDPSGAPGSTPVVRIRGVGTLNNANPIYVVDGVILDDISFLSNNDIESMEVLKDASATAIYGSRGANGVIIVTTKIGKVGKESPPAINFSYDYSFQHLQKKIDLLTGKEFAQVVNEINPGTFNNINRVANTDWQDKIFKDMMPIQNYHASVTGSGKKYSYYFGIGYYTQDGIIRKSNYQRLSVKLNNIYNLTDNVKVGVDLTVSPDKRNNEAGAIYQAYLAYPTDVPYKSDGSFAEVQGSGNPLASIEYNNSYTNNLRSVGSVFTDISLLKLFTYKSSFGFDINNTKDKSFTPEYYVSPTQSAAMNKLSVAMSEYRNWLWENTLNFNKDIKKHHFDVLAGITAQKNKSEYTSETIQNLIGDDPSLWYIRTGDTKTLTGDNGGEITAMESYLFRINYTFDKRFLFTTSYRIDGSSKFDKDNRWGYFPSFAAGWNIKNEKFMSSVKPVSTLKLRASWGIIGNEKIGQNSHYSLVDNGQNAVFGYSETLQQGASYAVTGNDKLKWENTTQTDAGLEIGLLEDKLSAEFDYYNKMTDDILVSLYTPGHMGNGPYATVTYNAAKVLNRGFEYNVSYKEKIGDFSYMVKIVGSTLYNEVKKLGATSGSGSFISNGSLGNGQMVTRTVVGEPIGEFYGYKVIGVFQNEEELRNYPHIDGAQVGDLKFANLNSSDSVIDEKDKTYLGSYIPKLMYGLVIELNYKAFDFSMDFNGQSGNKIYNGKNAVRPNLGNFESRVKNRWHGEGTSNSEPRATSGGPNYEPSSYFIEDGSFFRLRTISLGYTLPPKVLSKINVKQARVFIRGNNVFTMSKYSGYSPEISSDNALASGIDMGVYPSTAIYSIGFNVNF